MKYSDCKKAEDFDQLLAELLQLDAAYAAADKLDILSTPGVDADAEEEYYSHDQIRREWNI